MTGTLRAQGLLFCALALAVAACAPLLGTADHGFTLLLVASLVLLLGVPHGALDPVFAQYLHHVRGPVGWLTFGLAYLAVTGAVAALWWWTPGLFMAGFLLLSMLHFSDDLEAGVSWWGRQLYGGAVIVLPTLLHAGSVEKLFGMLMAPASAATLIHVLQALGWPWLVGLLLSAVLELRRAHQGSAEMASIALMAVIAPPLITFAVFFCLMHSARHVLRTIASSYALPPRRLLALSLPPQLLVIAAALLASTQMDLRALDQDVTRLLFVGLAALTVPHMALIECARRAGWGDPSSTAHLAELAQTPR